MVLQLVSDGAVGRQPHLLELKLLDTLLIWGDGRALDTDRVLLDSLGGIECYLVVGLVTVFQTEIVVLEVNVEVGVDELAYSVSLVPADLFMFFYWCWAYLVLDGLPDDPSHLISVKFHDGVLDLDFVD